MPTFEFESGYWPSFCGGNIIRSYPSRSPSRWRYNVNQVNPWVLLQSNVHSELSKLNSHFMPTKGWRVKSGKHDNTILYKKGTERTYDSMLKSIRRYNEGRVGDLHRMLFGTYGDVPQRVVDNGFKFKAALEPLGWDIRWSTQSLQKALPLELVSDLQSLDSMNIPSRYREVIGNIQTLTSLKPLHARLRIYDTRDRSLWGHASQLYVSAPEDLAFDGIKRLLATDVHATGLHWISDNIMHTEECSGYSNPSRMKTGYWIAKFLKLQREGGKYVMHEGRRIYYHVMPVICKNPVHNDRGTIVMAVSNLPIHTTPI